MTHPVRHERPEGASLTVAADLNADGAVSFADLNIVLSAFGMTGVPGSTPGDVNGDGVVNFLDLNAVLSFVGQVC